MLLLGNQSDRSMIDRIGSALQQKAQESSLSPSQDSQNMLHMTLSPTHTESPGPTSPSTSSATNGTPTPQAKKRPASVIECTTACKKPLFTPDHFKSADDEHSDSDGSDQCTNEDGASSIGISPQDALEPSGSNGHFCNVPGRLSLLSSTSKYSVSLAEIQRRLSHPENLNASILGGILRRAKSKNGGKELRDTLEKLGLSLPAGRRKSATVTLLTSLVEGEALHLAKDFTFICENELKVEDIAKQVTKKRSDQDPQRRRQALNGAMAILSELTDILNSDCSPIENIVREPVLDAQIQDPLSHFSHCTHGFGNPALMAGLNVAKRYISASLDSLEGPSPMNSLAQNLLMMHPAAALASAFQANSLNNGSGLNSGLNLNSLAAVLLQNELLSKLNEQSQQIIDVEK